MKKNGLLSDDIWVFQAPDVVTGAVATDAAHDTMFRDEGDLFPLADAAGSVFELVVSAAKPVASIATLADYLVNGYWAYNNTPAHHFASNTISYNINGLNAAEQFLAQTAMQAWSEVANITFVQTSGAASITFAHNGTMQAYTSGYWPGGSIAYQTVNISTDWVTNDGGAYDGKTGIDSYAYQTYIHEIGHALGLGHQGPYNGSASYSTNAVYANDTWQYSIMSYFSEPNYSGSSYRYVVTPQMADIYAVVSMYGAATSTRTGDTVYGFNSNAGAVFNFAGYTSAPALTIFDSGGNDTLDVSGYSSAQIIDLHPGSFSSVGGLVNNIGIALNAVIEKAIGGTGADRLIASDTGSQLLGGGGSDTLIGGAGNDKLLGGFGVDNLTGGGGGDTFAFLPGDSSAASGQHDRITDFMSGLDRIDLSGIDAISGTGASDLFTFIGASAFSGVAGQLNYTYNSALGVTMLQGDTNGDGVADLAVDILGNITIDSADLLGVFIGPIEIESFGSTRLAQNGSFYYLYNIGAGPQLKYNGAAVVAGQFTPWVLIGAEQTAAGYEVAWKQPGADYYTVWNTDSNGNFLNNPTGIVSGASVALKSLEPSFQQDLNGDGVIGVPSTIIDGAGSTSLVQIGSNYFLNPTAGSSGPSLKYNGAAVVADQFTPWVLIGAEQTAAGYEVAWKQPGADYYTVWNTDSNGNFLNNPTGIVSGASVALKSLEPSFQQDLNGDGVIGVPSTIIDGAGSTSLVQIGSNYFLNPTAGSSGPSIKYNGAAVVADQFTPWVLIGAEQTATGYEVAWKQPGADYYTVWNTDSNGNFLNNPTGIVSGASVALKSLEPSFQQDLNGDGMIGVPSTIIDGAGSTSLVQTGSNYFLNPTAGSSGPSLKYNGAAVVADQFTPWVLIGAEQTATGYEMAWKQPGADYYTVWNTDSNGNFLNNPTGIVSGASVALKSLEPSFQQDLNGDGVIGVPSTIIDGAGSTSLVQIGSNYFLNPTAGSSGPSLKYNGAAVVADQFTPWVLIGAEQTATGYEVAWKQPGADYYTVWNTDSNGNFLNNPTGIVSGASVALKSLEPSFQQDLNGDGVIDSFGVALGAPTSAWLLPAINQDSFVLESSLIGSNFIHKLKSDASTYQSALDQRMVQLVSGENALPNLGDLDLQKLHLPDAYWLV